MRSVTPDELGGSSKSAVVIGPFGSSLRTADFRETGVPLIFVRDIRAGDFSQPRAFVSEEKASELRAHLALPGDLVLTKMGDPPGDVAIYDGPVPALITADCIRLRPADGYDARYLLHAFRTRQVRQQVLDITSGAAQKKVSLERFRTRIAVPVPSLDKQHRIAAILDATDAIRTKRRQVLAHLDSLGQSIFHQMFGDPDDATRVQPFGSVADLRGGRNLVADDASAKTPFRVLKISAVTTGQFMPAESKPLPADYEPPADHLLRDGDLLMSRANTTEMVGAVAYVASAPPNLALPDKVWRFVWKAPCEPRFYHALLSTPALRRRISRLSSGTGGSMKNVSKAKLESMPVPVVDVTAQGEFVRRIDLVSQQRFKVQHALAADDELFDSLQASAFAGRL